jgi:fibrinogen beta/gamma subunit family protein
VVSLYSFYPFRRVDDSLEFYSNTWQQYRDGFNNGIENGNLWLGNDRIHVMSSQSNVTLRVEIKGDRNPNSQNPNIYLYGTYNFSVNTIST